MNTYNDIFKENTDVFGGKPTPLVARAVSLLEVSGKALDIGAGQGRDSLYMANLGFEVLATDVSDEACKQIEQKITKLGLKNVTVQNIGLEDLVIDQNAFDIISCINVLHFLGKDKAIDATEKIQKGLKINGLAVITLFIQKSGFQEQELKSLFKDFEIIFYFEGEIVDKGHPGQPEEHNHHVARIIARKLGQEYAHRHLAEETE